MVIIQLQSTFQFCDLVISLSNTRNDWLHSAMQLYVSFSLHRSDEPIMSLQTQHLGRGGIRNPVPRCVAMANQRLRPVFPNLFCLVYPLSLFVIP